MIEDLEPDIAARRFWETPHDDRAVVKYRLLLVLTQEGLIRKIEAISPGDAYVAGHSPAT